MGIIPYLILIFTASFANISTAVRVILIGLAIVLFIPAIYFALKLEREVGYYECQHCHERYVPTFKQVVLAPHKGRTRYMKCPKCGKRTYQIKVLTK